jgi:alcohol dehydrogenase
LYGAVGKNHYDKVKDVAGTGIALVVKYLPQVINNPQDKKAREALCLGTDLGGYSIMIGGTNGGHLTSFSLVDILSHGRACAMLNPYYTVFFAPEVKEPLKLIGEIYRSAGYSNADFDTLTEREAGVEIAESMFRMAGEIGVPTRLDEIDGFGREHIDRALDAAKNPQLRMKLQNMPVPLTADLVDEYMGPILEAAVDGDLSRIKNLSTG